MQFLLNDGDSGSVLRVRTIVAQALERNSSLLSLLADRSRDSVAEALEPRLLQQEAVWRLFMRSVHRTAARDACERLRQAQRLFEATVIGLAEARRLREPMATSDADAVLLLGRIEQRLLRQADQIQPRRDLEQLLLDDSKALQDLADDALDPAQRTLLNSALSTNLLQEARKAERRCQQALVAGASAEQRLRARRWLALHLDQMELFAPDLSEGAARRLWYRQRLLRVLERCAGIDVVQAELDHLLLSRQTSAREHQALSATLIARRASGGQRAVRLLRHGFPAPVARSAELLPAANADRMDVEPELRDIALP